MIMIARYYSVDRAPPPHPRDRWRRLRRREPLPRARRAPPGRRGGRARLAQAPRLRAQPAAPARGRRAFVHGDVRERDDLLGIEPVEAIVECSAEPSVLAGMGAARTSSCRRTSRRAQLPRARPPRRRAFRLPLDQPRLSRRSAARANLARTRRASRSRPRSPSRARREHGIAEDFPLAGARTLYGATKLAAELLLEEYAELRRPRQIDRCGVIAGPWQMGKVDQGVFTQWLLAHYSAARSAISATAGRASRCATCSTSTTSASSM